MPPDTMDITVLLVDDDQVDVMAVRRAFRQTGLADKMIVASDGQEALDILRDGNSVKRPYMVLLDLNMPRMNGIEFLTAARNDPALQDSVVFILTTSRAMEDKKRAYHHNVAGYIVKESTSEGYINAVELLNQYTRIVELP